MLLFRREDGISVTGGFMVPVGSVVRCRVDPDSGEEGDEIITLIVSDDCVGGSELYMDMPASVADEVGTVLREAVTELAKLRGRRQEDPVPDAVPYSAPG